MSDRIAVFNHGKIEQIGPPEQIYDQPATRFVAEFIGETNYLTGTVTAIDGDRATIDIGDGRNLTVLAGRSVAKGDAVDLSVRPERVRVGTASANTLSGIVEDVVYHGDHLQVVLTAGSHKLLVKADRAGMPVAIGDRLDVGFAPDDCWVIGS